MQVTDGFRFAWGAAAFLCLMWAISLPVDHFLPSGFDDSDTPPKRSGLSIKTDSLTGCQYLMTFTGSLAPRLDRDGKQICGARKPLPSPPTQTGG